MMLCYSYLALVAALASEADYVFIPEDPVKVDWKQKICQKILQVHIYTSTKTLILFAHKNTL